MLLGSITEIKIRKICSHFRGKKKRYALNIQCNVKVDKYDNKESKPNEKETNFRAVFYTYGHGRPL